LRGQLEPIAAQIRLVKEQLAQLTAQIETEFSDLD
jgi:hypothetical protein